MAIHGDTSLSILICPADRFDFATRVDARPLSLIFGMTLGEPGEPIPKCGPDTRLFSERISFADYIRRLKADEPLEVDGYVVRQTVAGVHRIRAGPRNKSLGVGSNRDHAVRAVKVEGGGASVFARPSMGRYVILNPDLSDFAQNIEWITRVLRKLGHEKM